MPATRTTPAETKLLICVWHPFTFWRPQPVMPETIRQRSPQMRVVHLPDYDRLREELPDTDIFIGYSLRAQQLTHAKKLKWIHSTAAGVAQLMYPELRDSGILVSDRLWVRETALLMDLLERWFDGANYSIRLILLEAIDLCM